MKVYILNTSNDGILGVYGSYRKALEAGKQYAAGVYCQAESKYDESTLEIREHKYTTRIYGVNESTIETEIIIR